MKKKNKEWRKKETKEENTNERDGNERKIRQGNGRTEMKK